MRRILPVLFFGLLVVVFRQPSLASEENVAPGERASLDFLYINANAGAAAGGHSALRLGNFVFHYQFFPDSTFLLVREPWGSFRFLYNELHNRTIATATLPLTADVVAKIRAHFTEILVQQNQFFTQRQDNDAEQTFFKELLAGNRFMAIPILGFFHREGGGVLENRVLETIESRLGAGALNRALILAEAQLQTSLERLGRGEFSARDLREVVSLNQALHVLIEGKGLVKNALIPALETEQDLSAEEKKLLESYAESQLVAIAELLRSSRPDRGEAILLHIVRYYALRSSVAAGRLLSLDPFYDGVRRVELSPAEVFGCQVRGLQRDLLQQVQRRRDLFFQEDRHPEIAYSLLETSRAKAWELLRVGPERREVRVLTRVTLPSRPGLVALPQLVMDRAQLENRLRNLGVNGERQQEVQELNYSYNLFHRNCATELLRSLNGSFRSPEAGTAALGGWLEASDGLVFIPFLFFEEAVTAYDLAPGALLPGRRLRNLEDLYNTENDLLVWLRESNTLSSTLYQARSRDTPFFFFTDDALLLRPLLGLVNVAYGAGHTLFGVVEMPFDGGSHLQQSLRGIFYSLPEMAFGNIRKGSYAVGKTEEDGRDVILDNGPTSL